MEELNVFRELETINKPSNSGVYIVDKDLTDLRSNLHVNAYTAKDSPSEGIPLVKYLRIYYRDSPQNIRKIEAEYNVVNAFYQSSRYLEMNFQEINNTITLTSYVVSGGQKMQLGDTVQYKVEGVITLPN